MIRRSRSLAAVAGAALLAAALWGRGRTGADVPSFADQVCALPEGWLALTRRGYEPARSGEISILPRPPVYWGSAAGAAWSAVHRAPPRLVVVVVWDGGGWNVLERWPDAWPTLGRMMRAGISY